jgi:hypothetical protein
MGVIIFSFNGSYYFQFQWELLFSVSMGVIIFSFYGSYYFQFRWELLFSVSMGVETENNNSH